MAKVTIVVEDSPGGGVNMHTDFEPAVPKDVADITDAQFAAIYMMHAMEHGPVSGWDETLTKDDGTKVRNGKEIQSD